MTRNTLSPLIKGIITATVMLGLSLAFLFTGIYEENSNLVYSVNVAYAAGIIWTIISFARANPGERTFSKLFNQGFRCFIIVTLIMVVYTAIVFNLHPEWADQAAEQYAKGLLNEVDRNPEERKRMVEEAKKGFVVSNIAQAIFGYLISGAVIAAVVSGLLIRRK